MKVTKDLKGYVLKHEGERYFTGCYSPINVYLTDEPLMATRFSTRELAEQAITNAKNVDRGCLRWAAEIAMNNIIAACTVKEINIHTSYDVED